MSDPTPDGPMPGDPTPGDPMAGVPMPGDPMPDLPPALHRALGTSDEGVRRRRADAVRRPAGTTPSPTPRPDRRCGSPRRGRRRGAGAGRAGAAAVREADRLAAVAGASVVETDLRRTLGDTGALPPQPATVTLCLQGCLDCQMRGAAKAQTLRQVLATAPEVRGADTACARTDLRPVSGYVVTFTVDERAGTTVEAPDLCLPLTVEGETFAQDDVVRSAVRDAFTSPMDTQDVQALVDACLAGAAVPTSALVGLTEPQAADAARAVGGACAPSGMTVGAWPGPPISRPTGSTSWCTTDASWPRPAEASHTSRNRRTTRSIAVRATRSSVPSRRTSRSWPMERRSSTRA